MAKIRLCVVVLFWRETIPNQPNPTNMIFETESSPPPLPPPCLPSGVELGEELKGKNMDGRKERKKKWIPQRRVPAWSPTAVLTGPNPA